MKNVLQRILPGRRHYIAPNYLVHHQRFPYSSINTRVGEITVRVPKTRGIEFSPSALDKDVRRERALELAVAEMFVKGQSRG